ANVLRADAVPTKLFASSTPLTGVTDVAAGSSHSIARKQDGTAWAWGMNTLGQLGNGAGTSRTGAVQVKNPSNTGGLTGVTGVAAGSHHSIAVTVDGAVWAWGYNSVGQLGDGTTATRNIPVQVKDNNGVALSDVVAVAANSFQSYALHRGGTVWAWGYNAYGALGDGTTTSRVGAVQVQNNWGAILDDVVAIAAGTYHCLALKSDGTVWAWGDNSYSQLGEEMSSMQTRAVQVMSAYGITLSGVAAISTCGTHCFALKTDGTLATWGSAAYGQLGTGYSLYFGEAKPVRGINLYTHAPSVEIVSPALSQPHTAAVGESFGLSLALFDDSDSIGKVEIFNEGVKLGELHGGAPEAEIELETWGEFHISALAYDHLNTPSLASPSLTVRVLPLIDLATVARHLNSLELACDASNVLASTLVLERLGADGVTWSPIGTIAGPVGGYSDQGLQPGTFYFYRARAYASSGVEVGRSRAISGLTLVDTDNDTIPDE
ncbi:MAG: hypothetical protein EOP84_25225, partial [Verrucomicrobiaceae bacterium]